MTLDFSDGFGGDRCMTLPIVSEVKLGLCAHHESERVFQGYMVPASNRRGYPSPPRLALSLPQGRMWYPFRWDHARIGTILELACVILGGTTTVQYNHSSWILLTKQPFSAVQASRAIQAPIALGGSVYKNVESLWLGTSNQHAIQPQGRQAHRSPQSWVVYR